MEGTGIVFDISRFCLNDGPGIRTTVFFKGCPLRCKWCHNPESQRIQPEILYSEDRCAGCGRCVSVCGSGCHIIEETHLFRRSGCAGCGKCANACAAGALRLAGRRYTAEDIMKEVLRDRVFYEESGGGLTVSGGEPMMQADFLEALFEKAKREGIHTCIETCGYAPMEDFRRIAPLTDCFLFDWKESDPEKHRSFTGAGNELIRENLRFLDMLGADIILRMPLIPGYNDTREHIEGTARLVNELANVKRIEIMPYHPLGTSKTKELGREDDCTAFVPDKALLDGFLAGLRKKTAVPVELSV